MALTKDQKGRLIEHTHKNTDLTSGYKETLNNGKMILKYSGKRMLFNESC